MEHGVKILGTDVDAIDRSEDRERFQLLAEKLQLKQPSNKTVKNFEEALIASEKIGFPIVVRPSYVLGGRAMELVHNTLELEKYLKEAVEVSDQKPILLDGYLTDAVEVDVDVISDGDVLKLEEFCSISSKLESILVILHALCHHIAFLILLLQKLRPNL